jgi:hypothetical protein
MLTDFQIVTTPYTAEAPISVSAGYSDTSNKKLVMFVGGGLSNTNYSLSMVVHTDQGQVKQDYIGMRIFP